MSAGRRGDPKVCIALLDVSHSQLRKLLGTPTTAIKKNALSVPLLSQSVVEQKAIYIHNNPVRGNWMLAEEPHKYKYSSASYYHTGVDEFGFLENFMNACDEDEW